MLKNLKYFKGETRVMCAAVSVIISEQNDIILIRRAERIGDPWSGHIGFPGGRVEDSDDNNPFKTAIRETKEEVGIELNEKNFIQPLTPLTPEKDFKGFQLELWPFLFEASIENQIKLDKNEVQNIVRLPMGKLIDEFEIREKSFQLFDGREMILPSFTLDSGEIIWGLTLMILQEIKNLNLRKIK